jgi:hypothetical protein
MRLPDRATGLLIFGLGAGVRSARWRRRPLQRRRPVSPLGSTALQPGGLARVRADGRRMPILCRPGRGGQLGEIGRRNTFRCLSRSSDLFEAPCPLLRLAHLRELDYRHGCESTCFYGQESRESAAQRPDTPSGISRPHKVPGRDRSRLASPVSLQVPPGAAQAAAGSAPAALACRLGVMTRLAERSPVPLVPEQFRITSVRHDVVYDRCRHHAPLGLAPHAQPVPCQVRSPSPPPSGAVASARRARALPVQRPLHLRRGLRAGRACDMRLEDRCRWLQRGISGACSSISGR